MRNKINLENKLDLENIYFKNVNYNDKTKI